MSNLTTPVVIEAVGVPGPVGVLPAGNWNSGTAYVERQAVVYDGSSWWCLRPHTNQVPALGSTYWQLLARAGDDGVNGLSAYQQWLALGNTGTAEQFLASLHGTNGQSAFELWLATNPGGTPSAFLASLRGERGKSAYDVWLETHTGTPADFFASLEGDKGDTGDVTPEALAARDAARVAALQTAARIVQQSDVAIITSVSPVASAMEMVLVPDGLPVEYTYTRAGDDTYANVYGQTQNQAANEPGIDHDRLTGRVLGLKMSQAPNPAVFWIPSTEWLNPLGEGSFYTEWEHTATPTTDPHTVVDLNDGTANNRVVLQALNNTLRLQAITGGTVRSTVTLPLARASGVVSAAFSYKSNLLKLAVSTGYVDSTTTVTVPAFSRAHFGCSAQGAAQLEGYLRRFVYFPRVLSEPVLRLMAGSTLDTEAYFASLGWPT